MPQDRYEIVLGLAKQAGMPDPKGEIMSRPPSERLKAWQQVLEAASTKAATDMELESLDHAAKGLGLPMPWRSGGGKMMKLGGPVQPDAAPQDAGPQALGRSLSGQGRQNIPFIPREAIPEMPSLDESYQDEEYQPRGYPMRNTMLMRRR